MNWLKDFMKDRYGGDQLSMVLLVLSLVMSILGSVLAWAWLVFLSYLPLVFSIYRIFSKKRDKRAMENYRFAMKMGPFYKSYYRLKARLKKKKDYKTFNCPHCQARIRVPRKKGKVKVTCPKCQETFIKKT